ncbi:ABC-type polar amino acid transport system ATPase component [Nucleospora cyclopteri]
MRIENENHANSTTSNGKRLMGISWNNLSVRNFGGNEIFLYSCNGAALQGQILCILGGSASGKSLLMEVITSNMCRAYKKRGISEDIYEYCTYISEINMFSMEEFTVEENIQLALFLSMRNTLGDEYSQIMHDVWNEKVKTISVFYKHLLSLCLTDILEREILIYDEPFTELMDDQIDSIMRFLKTIAQKGVIVIISCYLSQFDEYIYSNVDQVYCLLHERCVFHGSPKALYIYLCNPIHILPNSILKQMSEIDVIEYALNMCPNDDENKQSAIVRQRNLVVTWSDRENSSMDYNVVVFTPDSSHWTNYEFLNFRSFIFILKTIFTKKINIFVYFVSLIVPEILYYLLAYFSDSDEIENCFKLDIKIDGTPYKYNEGPVKVTLENFKTIFAYFEIKKGLENSTDNTGEELATVANFLSNFIAEKILTIYIARYLFITQYPYTAYFFKNSLISRNKKCNFLNTDSVLIINIIGRLPNIIMEYFTNLLVFKKLLFINVHVVLKYFLMHLSFCIFLIIFNMQLMRHCSINIGLIIYKMIIFSFLYILYSLSKYLKFIITQIFLFNIFTKVGKEFFIILASLTVSILLERSSLEI